MTALIQVTELPELLCGSCFNRRARYAVLVSNLSTAGRREYSVCGHCKDIIIAMAERGGELIS